ncbi:hypothetical protein ALP12_03494 [Pseudomonas savastanoi pv. phaseolicola]|uniref:alkaline phosphatase family protein n=1 Tax=Pseudomonas savastanoi TaxID=29438 RepID=UPI0006B9102F|nr:alkaline phosphatase family protein [Pseudomonas savastanoi]KPB39198.1 Uncharacterized protein AC515_5214 [Pseudomonas savastanoi pv. phaseolicola]RMV30820.1 hypothetical protein ALP12_03494 [Pseudomonas savastanoi pv. phaseolicola]
MSRQSLLWLLVDGLSRDLYQRLRNRMGIQANHAATLEPLFPNCQTPPSLFSIWSAEPVALHGLTGYEIPEAVAGNPAHWRDAFQVWPRESLMAWDYFAQAGRAIRTCGVPFVQPERLGAQLLSHTEVYLNPVLPLSIVRAGECLRCEALGLSFRVHADEVAMVLVDEQGKQARIALDETRHLPLSPAIPVGAGGESHRAFAVRAVIIDQQLCLCVLGFQPIRVHGSLAGERRRQLMDRAYVAGNPGKLYAAGELGGRLNEGGSGAAELLLLDLLDSVHQSFVADVVLALEAGDSDLTVAYYPVIDLVCHQLLRYLEDASTPQLLFEAIEQRLARWLDELFAACQTASGKETRFIAHSDHGMQPIWWDIRPNRLFLELGWLALDAQGNLDAQRSNVFFHPAENGLLVLRLEPAGIGMLGAPQVLDALQTAFAELGEGGFTLLQGAAATLGSGWRSDLYLQPPPGVRVRADHTGALIESSRKGGDHSVWSDAASLKGVLLELGAAPSRPWPQPLCLEQLLPRLLNDLFISNPLTAPGIS